MRTVIHIMVMVLFAWVVFVGAIWLERWALGSNPGGMNASHFFYLLGGILLASVVIALWNSRAPTLSAFVVGSAAYLLIALPWSPILRLAAPETTKMPPLSISNILFLLLYGVIVGAVSGVVGFGVSRIYQVARDVFLG